jgi:hypothetical protein
MIRYPISRKGLEALITAEKGDWLVRAQERTDQFRAIGRYEEKSSIWSEVKVVYMRLQGNSKCAYCERKLEAIDLGKAEQDVEHFRPKGSVNAWKVPPEMKDRGIPFAQPPDKGGYFLLPYHLGNYSAACKPCNSALKKDYFPIAGKHDLTGEDPKKLKKEKPYLIYPIGDSDNDPEDLIRFHGTSPQPAFASGHKRHRALVTIEFFKLDDPNKRKNLIRERVMVILLMHSYLEKLKAPATTTEKALAKTIVDRTTHPNAPHTNCARSFRLLFEKDPDEAKSIVEKAAQLLDSIS